MIRDYNDEELSFIISKLDLFIGLKMVFDAGYTLDGKNIYLSTNYDNSYETRDDYYDKITAMLGYRTQYDDASSEEGLVLGYELFADPEEYQIARYLVNHPDLDEYLSHFKDYDQVPKHFHVLVSDICDDHAYYSDYEYSESFVPKNLSGIIILHSHMEWVTSATAKAFIDILDYCRKENELWKAGERTNDGTTELTNSAGESSDGNTTS